MSSCRWFCPVPERSLCSLALFLLSLNYSPSIPLFWPDQSVGAQQSYSLMAVSLATAVKCLFRTQANLDNLTVKWNRGQRTVGGTQPSSGDGEELFPRPYVALEWAHMWEGLRIAKIAQVLAMGLYGARGSLSIQGLSGLHNKTLSQHTHTYTHTG